MVDRSEKVSSFNCSLISCFLYLKIDYLKEVERHRVTDNQIQATNAFLENNKSSSDVKTTIEKIYRTNQIPFYYIGGLRALASILTDSKRMLSF